MKRLLYPILILTFLIGCDDFFLTSSLKKHLFYN